MKPVSSSTWPQLPPSSYRPPFLALSLLTDYTGFPFPVMLWKAAAAVWQSVLPHILSFLPQAVGAEAARAAAAQRRAGAEAALAAAHKLRQEATDSFTAACPGLDGAVAGLHPACTSLQTALTNLQAEGESSTTALTELLRLAHVSRTLSCLVAVG